MRTPSAFVALWVLLASLALAQSAQGGPRINPEFLRLVAQHYQGIPYLWGGTNPSVGLDCSAFSQRVYLHLGVLLPRTAAQQFNSLPPVAANDELRPGDLLFFEAPNRPVDHVAVYLWSGYMIHASYAAGRVVVEPAIRLQPRYIGARRVLR